MPSELSQASHSRQEMLTVVMQSSSIAVLRMVCIDPLTF
jgi:hypothetical protein